jgi:hypothetical protein
MICPKCGLEQEEGNRECLRCGIVFAKYKEGKDLFSKPESIPTDESVETLEKEPLFKDLFFHVEFDTNPLYLGGRALLIIILLIWGWRLALCPLKSTCVFESFLHLINLPFHEAGHIIFRPFGRYMTSLGGSLGQLLMPVICGIALILTRRDSFGGSVCLWWFGQNFIDLAPYIYDARAGVLPLVGGNTGRTSPYGFHDWEFLLNEVGLLRYDHLIAGIAHKVGIVLMSIAILWGGYLLIRQYKNLS